jgi:hypothetical protein
MTTIISTAIIITLSALLLRAECRNAKLRKELGETLKDIADLAAENDKQVFVHERAFDEWYGECEGLRERLAKFETYKTLRRDELGRFIAKGADPQNR